MASKETYSVKVEHNKITDEYYVVLPDYLLKRVNWQSGDKIIWKQQKDGSFLLSKINE